MSRDEIPLKWCHTLFKVNPIIPFTWILIEILYTIIAQWAAKLPEFKIWGPKNGDSWTTPRAARMHGTSFESPDQGPLTVCLVKSVLALLWHVMSLYQFTSWNTRFDCLLL